MKKERCINDFERERMIKGYKDILTSFCRMTPVASRHAELVSTSSRYYHNKTLKQVQGDGGIDWDDERRRGFTLIELLVVVLILAILAAIALPQYQRAVIKAKIAADISLARAILDAQEFYVLEHGKWTCKISDLAIDFNFDRKDIENEVEDSHCDKRYVSYIGSGRGRREFVLTGGMIFYQWHGTGVHIDYYGSLVRTTRSNGHFGTCYSDAGSEVGDKVCASMGILREGKSVQGTPKYWIY